MGLKWFFYVFCFPAELLKLWSLTFQLIPKLVFIFMRSCISLFFLFSLNSALNLLKSPDSKVKMETVEILNLEEKGFCFSSVFQLACTYLLSLCPTALFLSPQTSRLSPSPPKGATYLCIRETPFRSSTRNYLVSHPPTPLSCPLCSQQETILLHHPSRTRWPLNLSVLCGGSVGALL